MKRITLSLLSTLALVLIPASASAMTDAEFAEAQAMTEAMEQLYGSPAFGETGDGLPDIAVSEVRSSAREYQAGQEVKGSFTATNPTEYPAEGTYRALLVGNFDELGQYRTAYGVEDDEVVFALAPGQSRQIPFSMKIPAGLTGEGFRIRIQARLVGSQMRGWSDSDEISVSGDGGYATVAGAYLIGGDGIERALGSGPFLDERLPSVDLVATFVAGPKDVALSPRATLANRGTGEKATFSGAAVTVPANGRAEARLSFPRGNLAPGVYEGEVKWLGSDGAERASAMPVRLVVVGESATVHAIRSSASSVSAGQDFAVTLDVSGTPRDPDAPKGENASRSIWQAEVRVEVTSLGEAVGSGSWRGVLPADGSIDVPVSAERDGADMRAKVTVLGSKGQEVFSREYALAAAAGSGEALPPAAGAGLAFWWSVSACVALLVILVALIARRHRAVAATVAALGLVLAAALSSGAGNSSAEAAAFACPFGQNEWDDILAKKDDSASNPWKSQYTVFKDACAISRQPDDTSLLESDGTFSESVPLGIYINTPPSNTKLYCGQSVHVTGTAYYTSCYNTGMDAHTKAWITRLEPDGSWKPVTPVKEVSYSVGATDVHEWYTIDTPFALDTNLTTRDGKYRINVTAQTYGGLGTPHASGAYRDFLVENCDLCKNIAGDQNVVPGGLSRDGNKNCNCPSGSVYNVSSGQCENGDGVCVTCGLEGSCPAGTKYCDGVCIPDSAVCGGVVSTSCPIEPDSQYCAEIFDRSGARTDQFAGYSLQELEQIFGLGLREAVDAQAGSANKDSIWGAVGRSTSLQGGLDARHGSSGCGGVLCTYGIDGCLATTDIDSGAMAANCSPVNDPAPGGLGPKALLVVEPTVINQGGQCRISWSSHEMKTCQLVGLGISSSALAGSSMTPALQETATYKLDCVDFSGQAHRQAESCTVDPDVSEF